MFISDWYGAVQAMVIFGFFGTLISFFLLILFLFVGKCQKNGEIAFAAGIICIVTGKYRRTIVKLKKMNIKSDSRK